MQEMMCARFHCVLPPTTKMYSQLLIPAILITCASAIPFSIKRQSSVPYGAQILSCTKPGIVALTFDDGPYLYTEQLLNSLVGSGMKVTFFLNGQNLGNINDNAALVQRMIADGHQVGSHT